MCDRRDGGLVEDIAPCGEHYMRENGRKFKLGLKWKVDWQL
jgi:hypothetical protein